VAALSLVYLVPVAVLPSLTGATWWDGVAGVVLGLFICSLPVRHFLDMLIYWRVEGRRLLSRGILPWWIAGNAAVLFLGWFVIFVGTTRFTIAAR
jgi:hypothetical protein